MCNPILAYNDPIVMARERIFVLCLKERFDKGKRLIGEEKTGEFSRLPGIHQALIGSHKIQV